MAKLTGTQRKALASLLRYDGIRDAPDTLSRYRRITVKRLCDEGLITKATDPVYAWHGGYFVLTNKGRRIVQNFLQVKLQGSS